MGRERFVSVVLRYDPNDVRQWLLTCQDEGGLTVAGNIARRPDGRWRARYRDVQHKEHSRHFATKRAAQRWRDEVAAAMRVGRHFDPQSGRISMGSGRDGGWRPRSI